MNDLQVFSNPEFGSIRTIMLDEMPWWVGKDIATSLGYSNASKAVSAHVDNEDRQTMVLPYSQNGNTIGKLVVINESGLYSLILSSKLPSAKRFKRWITSEVLPALRRTGSYTMPGTDLAPIEQRDLTRDDYLRAAAVISNCKAVQLPYVLSLLKQGGFSIPDLSPISGADNAVCVEAVRLINIAINDYGMTLQQIGNLIGVHRGQIQRYRCGTCKPSPMRARLIVDALAGAIGQDITKIE